MKKLALLFIVLLIASCESKPKNYATLSGKISPANQEKTLTILNRYGYKKEIAITNDGTFKDTLNIEEGNYFFTSNGNEYGSIYLKNNNETSFTFDSEKFYETLKFSGDAADENNFYVANILLREKYLTEDLMSKTEAEFDAVFFNFKNEYSELKKSYKNLDVDFYNNLDTEFERLERDYKAFHSKKLAVINAFPKGSPSPTFENFENFNGGTTSLSDLKGAYVYIDVWATWCAPCIREIPALKKLDAQYHGKNIEFVSLSIDDNTRHGGSWDKAKTSWKNMVGNKSLSGIQLLASNGWQSDFVQSYKIDGIPRFILIDPDGNIVSADAPRPSDPSLINLFNSLNI